MLTDIFYAANGQAKPVVIFVHGFKGFKDWGHFNAMAKHFADAGFVFVKFNFSHNGVTETDPMAFTDPEAFGNNNYIFELNDLQAVIDSLPSVGNLVKEIDPEHICLVGHSRGGGIAILKAAEEPRVKKLVTWASVSDFIHRNKKKTIDTWKRDGVVYATNARTGQKMPMYYQFYETLMANQDRLNIHDAVRKLGIPFLIVHGTDDEAVPSQEAEHLRHWASNAELLLVEGAGHTFGVRHPFQGGSLPENAQLVIFKTIEFLKT